jgi:tripartite-type tricarboxylate transporter receptor subunit TctC
VPGYEAVSWYALYVPTHTPPEIVKKMNSDCVAMLNDPTVKQRYEPLGIVAAGSSPEQLAAMNVSDVTHWAPIIKAANIKGE